MLQIELLQVTPPAERRGRRKKRLLSPADSAMIAPTIMTSPSRYDDLSELLQSWTADTEPGVDFNRSVWSRIEAAESSNRNLSVSFFGWLQELARPRIAVSAAAVALFGGVLLGGLQARSAQEELYLLSLDPYHAVSSLPHR